MNPPPRAPRLRGLRFAVTDDTAAASVLQRVLGATIERREPLRWPRLRLAGQWIELRTTRGDTLDLQCDDLARQRMHLARLGIEALDGSALGCAPRLRLETVDTGACTVDLHDAPSEPATDAATNDHAHLCGLELAVRTPERVALHWAQLFHARAMHDARGLPALSLDRLDLRFTLAADGRAAVTAMDFCVDDMDALLRGASSHGMAIRHEACRRAALDALGIRFGLRPAV